MPYNIYIMELAAYLHDWGTFPGYIEKKREHAIRSGQVAETDILPQLDLTDESPATGHEGTGPFRSPLWRVSLSG